MATAIRPLRFGALIRVSTEKQEKQGESLRTQRSDNERDVEWLEGTIAEWYGGQEHATPGYVTREVDRLLSDVQKGKLDAVIVAHQDRWSRDNGKSKAGLEVLRNHGVRFFVGTHEYDLFNPTAKFFLGVSAEIGELTAGTQNEKSTRNRIKRAQRGIPTGGKMPFGRNFNRKTEKWEIDSVKQEMIEDVAKRYLAGESMGDLADEYGINHTNLHKTLTKRCGEDWQIKFVVPKLAINEVVPIKIPRLLPQKTIDAILKRVASRKTFSRAQPKNKYLLSRLIFCDHCDYALFGQMNHAGTAGEKPYYRHAHVKRCRECPCKLKKRKWAAAKIIEENVLRRLFDLFANPVRIGKAIEAATPNRSKIADLGKRQKHLEGSLAKTRKSKSRLLTLSENDAELADDAELKKRLTELREQESKTQEQLEQVTDQLENVPTSDSVRKAAKYVNVRIWALQSSSNNYRDMSWEEKRALLELVFDGTTPDGKRCGVYIRWKMADNGKPMWRYSIRGAINEKFRIPMSLDDVSEYYDDPEVVEFNRGVTPCASHLRARGRPARRSRPPGVPRLDESKQSPAARGRASRVPS